MPSPENLRRACDAGSSPRDRSELEVSRNNPRPEASTRDSDSFSEVSTVTFEDPSLPWLQEIYAEPQKDIDDAAAHWRSPSAWSIDGAGMTPRSGPQGPSAGSTPRLDAPPEALQAAETSSSPAVQRLPQLRLTRVSSALEPGDSRSAACTELPTLSPQSRSSGASSPSSTRRDPHHARDTPEDPALRSATHVHSGSEPVTTSGSSNGGQLHHLTREVMRLVAAMMQPDERMQLKHLGCRCALAFFKDPRDRRAFGCLPGVTDSLVRMLGVEQLQPAALRCLVELCDSRRCRSRLLRAGRKSGAFGTPPPVVVLLRDLLPTFHRRGQHQLRDEAAELLVQLGHEDIVGVLLKSLRDSELPATLAEIKAILREKARRRDYALLEKVKRMFSRAELLQFQQTFQSIDKDASGSIDLDELDTMFQEMGVFLPANQLARLMEEVDVDRSGTIEFNEFLLVMKKVKEGKLSGLGGVFVRAALKGKVLDALSAAREAIFGMSRKKRRMLEELEKERRAKQDQEAYEQREMEWLRSHKLLMRHGSVVDRLQVRLERAKLYETWVLSARELFEKVDADNDSRVTWMQMVEVLNEEEDLAAEVGVNMEVPGNLCVGLGIRPLRKVDFHGFLDMLKRVTRWCRHESAPYAVSHSAAMLETLRDEDAPTSIRRNEASTIRLAVRKREKAKEEARLQANAEAEAREAAKAEAARSRRRGGLLGASAVFSGGARRDDGEVVGGDVESEARAVEQSAGSVASSQQQDSEESTPRARAHQGIIEQSTASTRFSREGGDDSYTSEGEATGEWKDGS